MRVDRARFGLAILLVAVIFLVLAGLFWNFVRDTIAVPIYYLMWLGDLTLKSIPQQIFLGLLVIVCIIIGLNVLLAIRINEHIESAEASPVQTGARYHYWRNLNVQLNSSAYATEKFAAESRKMILSVLAYQEAIDAAEALTRVRRGTLRVPVTVKNLILSEQIQPLQQTPGSKDNSVLGRLRKWFGNSELPQIDGQVEEIIRFIEQLLETGDAGYDGEPRG